MRFLRTLLLAMIFAWPAAAAGPLENSALILTYFDVQEEDPGPSGLIQADFEAHLALVENKVRAVPEIVVALKAGRQLAPGTIGITFDSPLQSLNARVFPALLEKDIPFTVFVNPAAIGASPQVMDWDALKKLAQEKTVTLGLSIAQISGDTVRTKADFNAALSVFREHLGFQPKLFAYPYGAYTKTLKSLVREAAFEAAFGLQSGAVYEGSDFLALPRFTMAGEYGTPERLSGILTTLPLPASDLSPEENLFAAEPPGIGFSVEPAYKDLLPHISCYAGGQGRVTPEILGEYRVEIRPKAGLAERIRVNCTAPAEPGNPKNTAKRWIGFLLVPAEALNNQPQPELLQPPE